jgi:hypothetical protein
VPGRPRFVAIVAARSLRRDAIGDRVRGRQQLVGGVQLGDEADVASLVAPIAGR